MERVCGAVTVSEDGDEDVRFEFLLDVTESISPFHLMVTSSSALVG